MTKRNDARLQIPESWQIDMSAVLENRWNEDAAKFVRIVQENPNFWWFDHELKYLNLRIDTRDSAFLLFSDTDRDGEKKRINADRVLEAIRRLHSQFPSVKP